MKAWTDLSKIEMPERIKALPTDERGYPKPFVAAVINGKHDFRVLGDNVLHCAQGHRRGICGQRITGLFSFVGGFNCAEQHLYTDPWMHYECARYAVQVCPFLAAPKFEYSRHLQPGVERLDVVSDTRSGINYVGTTSKVRAVIVKEGLFFQAGGWDFMEKWERGSLVQNLPEYIGRKTSIAALEF